MSALSGSPLAEHLGPITRFYFEFHEDVGEGYRAQIHDLLTVMVALGQVSSAGELATIDLDPDSELFRGTAVADVKRIWERGPNARIITDADIDAAWALFDASCRIHSRIANGDAELDRLRHLRAED